MVVTKNKLLLQKKKLNSSFFLYIPLITSEFIKKTSELKFSKKAKIKYVEKKLANIIDKC